MKYILILLLFFPFSTVLADVEMPEAIMDAELPGNWYAIDGNGMLVYRLKIEEDLNAALLSIYTSTESKGMDVFPEGKVRNVSGNLSFSFSESPTTYNKLNLTGKGFSCNEGECLLVLRESVESKPIYFYKKPLAVLARQILSAEGMFEEYAP
ncbi:hypothetical protein [Microbulbifer halophilus]|uniref:Thiol:disulfide interchange protein DsbD N-terminal domain-containing protein n=1 Tax=Microbulbifer halophilus TaxID=453963 RepID=A0ABW5EKG9_9GAMM|nr:hypothetical protein [Microbulbifer halophilus]MCW8128728.1 hypothetical protein [Microbulbifer halophilus]